MARAGFVTVARALDRQIRESGRLAKEVHQWHATGSPMGPLSVERRDALLTLAFFKVFVAWETFLEDSFVLCMIGRPVPPMGRRVKRFAFPSNADAAMDWLLPEHSGRQYVEWDTAPDVVRRAKRFFVDGCPFADPLDQNQTFFYEAKLIRNAIAHHSTSARQKFEEIARQRLGGALPPGLTVGGYLAMPVPRLSPPQSFLEQYLDKVRLVASLIVPVI